uniref:Putative secreted peptide n=1 Tax=Anopheles braziliensis TaxID=58242 RepID=A0A2M3ZTI3_9DIPT
MLLHSAAIKPMGVTLSVSLFLICSRSSQFLTFLLPLTVPSVDGRSSKGKDEISIMYKDRYALKRGDGLKEVTP